MSGTMLSTCRFRLLRSSVKSNNCLSNVETLASSLNSCQKSSTAEAVDEIPSTYDQAEPFSNIPGPQGYPFIGTWLYYKRNPEKVRRRDLHLREIHAEYGDIVKENLPGFTLVHLFSPNYTKQIYENEGKYPNIPPLLPYVDFYRREREMAPGLGNSNGDEWYNLRAAIQQILVRPQIALDYLPLQNEVADLFVDKLESMIPASGGELENMNRWFYRWGLASSVNTFFEMYRGYFDESGMPEADKIISSNANILDTSVDLTFALPINQHFPTKIIKQLFRDEDYVNLMGDTLLNVASKNFKDQLDGKNNEEKKYLFLSYILANKAITARDIQAVVTSVLTDTLSTTSQAILFNMYTLAANPEAQERVYQEAMTALSDTGELTVQGFNSCAYTKAFMKETFRTYPVGLEVQRLCPADMVIGGFQVPKGTMLSMASFVYMNDPAYIPNPDAFLPERWLRGNKLYIKPHPFLLVPFSMGTRMCIGRRFAEQELVMLIAKVLRKFKLEWHHEKLTQRFRMLQVPGREVSIKFVPRNG